MSYQLVHLSHVCGGFYLPTQAPTIYKPRMHDMIDEQIMPEQLNIDDYYQKRLRDKGTSPETLRFICDVVGILGTIIGAKK